MELLTGLDRTNLAILVTFSEPRVYDLTARARACILALLLRNRSKDSFRGVLGAGDDPGVPDV